MARGVGRPRAKRGRKKGWRKHRPGDSAEKDELPFDAARRRVVTQIARIRKEQWFLETYRMEGWRGASKEKLKPKDELKRAQNAIEQAKQNICQNMRLLDEAGGGVAIPADAFTESGELPEEAIFCSVCLGLDAVEGNDILLCDGPCGRAYHQMCVHPPLETKDIPPGEEGWLCPACDAKVDCIYHINNLLDTSMPFSTTWSELFEGRRGNLHENMGLATPERRNSGHHFGNTVAGNPEAGGGVDFLSMELPSEESEDGDFDPPSDSDDDDASMSSSAHCHAYYYSSDSEDCHNSSQGSAESSPRAMPTHSDEQGEDEGVVVTGKRRRGRVDYKKLNELLFGGNEAYEGEITTDGEWSPGKVSTPTSEGKRENGRARKNTGRRKVIGTPRGRKNFPASAVKELKKSFRECKSPSMSARDDLASSTGLTLKQVNTWFANERRKGKVKASV